MESPRKRLGVGLICLGGLLVMLISACSQSATPTLQARATAKAFKGMELYSWQTSKEEWQFSLLPGTNRMKTGEEIVAHPMTLDEIKTSLQALAVDEQVFWSEWYPEQANQGITFDFPPDDMVQQIRKVAQESQINLVVVSG